ncbi:MAG: OmpH family outer membrane protein [Desulfobacterales bacterium]|nr:OmpH family outer membrane protein [Desulfobacterales bacterium]
MKPFKIALATTIFFLFPLIMGAYAADIEKIGIIDFQKVVANSAAGKKVQAEIKKKGEEMKTDLQNRGAEIEELKKRLDVDAMVMTQEKRDEKEREFRIKLNDFKVAQKRHEEEFKKMQNQLIGKIRNDLFEVVNEYGTKEGYSLIIEKSAVIFYPNSKDITDKVIPIYNAKSGN